MINFFTLLGEKTGAISFWRQHFSWHFSSAAYWTMPATQGLEHQRKSFKLLQSKTLPSLPSPENSVNLAANILGYIMLGFWAHVLAIIVCPFFYHSAKSFLECFQKMTNGALGLIGKGELFSSVSENDYSFLPVWIYALPGIICGFIAGLLAGGLIFITRGDDCIRFGWSFIKTLGNIPMQTSIGCWNILAATVNIAVNLGESKSMQEYLSTTKNRTMPGKVLGAFGYVVGLSLSPVVFIFTAIWAQVLLPCIFAFSIKRQPSFKTSSDHLVESSIEVKCPPSSPTFCGPYYQGESTVEERSPLLPSSKEHYSSPLFAKLESSPRQTIQEAKKVESSNQAAKSTSAHPIRVSTSPFSIFNKPMISDKKCSYRPGELAALYLAVRL